MPRRGFATLFFLGLLAVQIALKLWLVHRHEVAACDYPHDDPRYVVASTRWYWGGSYADGDFSRPPAYPLWIALSRSVGLPLRLSTELLLLAAAGTLVFALLRVGLPRVVAVLVFGVIVFHPFTIYVNDSVMADSLYAPLLLFATAGMIATLGCRDNRRAALWTGLALAGLWHTRQESLLIVLNVGLFALVTTWVRTGEGHRVGDIGRDLVAVLLVLAIGVAGAGLAVRSANYARFGVFADHELAMPGFRAINGALLRLTQELQQCSVPIPQESLRRAYSVSPTFRLLQPYFEGPEGRHWEQLNPEDLRDQIAGGAFPWALRFAVHWAGYNDSAAAADAFWRRSAEEINAACETGALRCSRSLFAPLVLLRHCAMHLPAAFVEYAKLFAWRGAAFEPRCATPVNGTPNDDLFDRAANRRAALRSNALHLAGWAVNLVDPVRAVSFQDFEGRTVAFTNVLRARPDLDASFARQRAADSAPLLAAFELRIPYPFGRDVDGTLTFTLRSGKTVAVAYDRLRTAPLRHPFAVGDGGSLRYALEQRTVMQEVSGADDRALAVLFRSYGHAVVVLSVAALAALVVLLAARGWGRGQRVLGGVVLLLLGIVAVRVAAFAMVWALMWPGADSRYAYPAALLYPCALLVLIWCAVRARRPTLPR
jgi:hypothetical protein